MYRRSLFAAHLAEGVAQDREDGGRLHLLLVLVLPPTSTRRTEAASSAPHRYPPLPPLLRSPTLPHCQWLASSAPAPAALALGVVGLKAGDGVCVAQPGEGGCEEEGEEEGEKEEGEGEEEVEGVVRRGGGGGEGGGGGKGGGGKGGGGGGIEVGGEEGGEGGGERVKEVRGGRRVERMDAKCWVTRTRREGRLRSSLRSVSAEGRGAMGDSGWE